MTADTHIWTRSQPRLLTGIEASVPVAAGCFEVENGDMRELASQRDDPPRKVAVIAFQGVRFLDVIGPLEVFTVANEQGDHYAARVATAGGGDVVTTTGNRLGADLSLSDLRPNDIDTLLVAGSPNWQLLLDPELVSHLARLAPRARRVVSVCTGTFALAAAGLLDGRRAATHWRHAAALAKRFPEVEVDPDALFVRDGNVFTSAGIASGMDLGLALVEDDLGADVARTVAKILVVFLQRPGGQSQFSTWTNVPVVKDQPLRELLDEVALDPGGRHTLEAMAERSNFSVRHISRLFEEHIGMTPGMYVERVRLEAARGMLERGDESLQVVARRCGLGSAETLRRAFVREFGVPPGSYRSRFRTTGIEDRGANVWPQPLHRVPVSPPLQPTIDQ